MDFDNFFAIAEGFEWTSILVAVGVIAAVFIVLKLLKSGIKKILGFVLNAVVGCIILYVFSLLPTIEFTIVWWHALVTGLFGIPAAIIIIVCYFVI
ncbi:MAG: hypothetical protein HFK09_00455 [Clostridia bacterium]|nr:hypothetical protein [Clostridia bacterium]